MGSGIIHLKGCGWNGGAKDRWKAVLWACTKARNHGLQVVAMSVIGSNKVVLEAFLAHLCGLVVCIFVQASQAERKQGR